MTCGTAWRASARAISSQYQLAGARIADRGKRHPLIPGQGLDALSDPVGLCGDALGDVLLDRLAIWTGRGRRELRLPAIERAGERVGGPDQRAGGPVIVGQVRRDERAEVGSEACHDAGRHRAAPLVDRLVEVAEQRQVAGSARQRGDDLILGEVGVLDLVDLDEVVAARPVLQHVRAGREEGADVEDEIREVDELPLAEAALVLLGRLAESCDRRSRPAPRSPRAARAGGRWASAASCPGAAGRPGRPRDRRPRGSSGCGAASPRCRDRGRPRSRPSGRPASPRVGGCRRKAGGTSVARGVSPMSGKRARIRARSSRAARLVKVTQRMRSGGTPCGQGACDALGQDGGLAGPGRGQRQQGA